MSGGETYVQATEVLFLHPGELYAGRRPLLLKTILGSCVAVTLWHPATHMAGMCHFVLAQRPASQASEKRRDCDGRYGEDALDFLYTAAHATDPQLGNFRVGIFGGATLMRSARGESVGDANILLAQRRLRSYGFRVNQQDVGGAGGRVLALDSSNGAILLKYHTDRTEDSGRVTMGKLA